MKIIIYEGLFGILLGSKMSKAFEQACPGVPYQRRSWIDRSPIPENSVLIGHSFGAYACLIMAAKQKCLDCIVVDYRTWRPSLNNHNKAYYHGPDDTGYSFFQTRPLKGYAVNYMTNYPLGNWGHMKAPSHPLVIKKIREVCSV